MGSVAGDPPGVRFGIRRATWWLDWEVRAMARLLVAFLAIGAPLFAQDPNAVSPRDIERAIRKGTEFLKAAPFTPDRTHPCANDLILLTLIHAEVPETNPVLQQYLK